MRVFHSVILLLFSITVYASATAPGSYYVSATRLNVRLSPLSSGKITNLLDRGARVDVLEVKSGWARISKYYDGSIEGVKGKVARWVSARFLSKDKPNKNAQKSAPRSPLEQALSHSDDYRQYKEQFLASSKKLIKQGKCTVRDFVENGGWIRSTSKKLKPVYFMYCGGFRIQNRLYLNAATGKVFK